MLVGALVVYSSFFSIFFPGTYAGFISTLSNGDAFAIAINAK
jgi:hypothetical protein